MRLILYAIFAALLAFGLYQLSCVLLLHERSYSGRRILRKLAKWEQETTDSWSQSPLKELTAFAERFVYLDDTAHTALERRLSRAEMRLTPETYLARQYVTVAFGVLGVALCASIKFLGGALLIALLDTYVLLRQRERLTTVLQRKHDEIAAELPQFVYSICQQLRRSRDVVAAVTSYRKVAGEELGRELDILLSHIRSGSVAAALFQFQSRLSMEQVSRLCGALIEIDRGIDQTAGLQSVAEDMSRQIRLNEQKKLMRRPMLMRATFLPALGVWLAMILYALAAFALNQAKTLF